MNKFKLLTAIIFMMFSVTVFETSAFKQDEIQKSVKFVEKSTVQSFDCQTILTVDVTAPTDVGYVYSDSLNIDNQKQERFQTLQPINADFKVGWNVKGSQLINIYKNTSKDSQNNIATEKANLAITNADFKVGWQNYLNSQIEEKTPTAVFIGKYQEKA